MHKNCFYIIIFIMSYCNFICICFACNLFKKIILTNLVLEAPGRMGGIIRDLLDTEDLANRCLSMLNEHYNQELTIGIMETKMLKSD